MKKGLLSLVLITLLSLFVVIGVRDTKAQTTSGIYNDFIYQGTETPNYTTTIVSGYFSDLINYVSLNCNVGEHYNINTIYCIEYINLLQYHQYCFMDNIDFYYQDINTIVITLMPSNLVDLSSRDYVGLRYVITEYNTQFINLSSDSNFTIDALTFNQDSFNIIPIGLFFSIFRNNVPIYNYDINDVLTLKLNNCEFYLIDYQYQQNRYAYYINQITNLQNQKASLEAQVSDLTDDYNDLTNAYNSVIEQRNDANNFFTDLFGSFGELFSVEIIPGFTILTFIAIPLMLGLIAICIHLLKG